MAEFLSDAWVEQAGPAFDGLSERVQIVVSGGPDGEVRLGVADEPDLVLTTTSADARAVLDGTLDVNVAFMQGRLKSAGDNAVLLRILSRTRSEAFTEVREHLRSLTD